MSPLHALHSFARSALHRSRGVRAPTPVNLSERDVSPEAVAKDVEYAVKIGNEYLQQLAQVGLSARGIAVLELGPGINYGSALLLAAHDARVIVADRFLVPWQSPYHDRFYAELGAWVRRNAPEADASVVERFAASRGRASPLVREVAAPAESLREVGTAEVDVVLSNAMLEHSVRPTAVARELFRVTQPGGYGIHQVDFRDHRDFSRPLEYLLLSREEFARVFTASHGECGGQIRPGEMRECFEDAGFQVLGFDPNIVASDEYLDDFLPRLRAATTSQYRDFPAAELTAVSGRFLLRKLA